jgi:hypothetical protein
MLRVSALGKILLMAFRNPGHCHHIEQSVRWIHSIAVQRVNALLQALLHTLDLHMNVLTSEICACVWCKHEVKFTLSDGACSTVKRYDQDAKLG